MKMVSKKFKTNRIAQVISKKRTMKVNFKYLFITHKNMVTSL